MNSRTTSLRAFAALALLSGSLLLPTASHARQGDGDECPGGIPGCFIPDLPEPATLALIAVGVAGLALSRRKKK